MASAQHGTRRLIAHRAVWSMCLIAHVEPQVLTINIVSLTCTASFLRGGRRLARALAILPFPHTLGTSVISQTNKTGPHTDWQPQTNKLGQ